MRILRDLEPQQYFWPVKHSATKIVDGALLMPGVTAATDLGVLIVASGAGADAIGVLQGDLPVSVTDTLVAGTVWNTRLVHPVIPMRVLRIPYALSSTAVLTSNTATAVVCTTEANLEDNIDTSYLYAYDGTGEGELSFLVASASGGATQKTAMGWSSDTYVVKILRLFHQLATLNSTSDKLGTVAAAGSWKCLILQNTINYAGSGDVPLDPTKHDNLSGLNAYADLEFAAQVGVRNAGPYTVD
jgi:hypothetical protein